jgi:hypothetical protein
LLLLLKLYFEFENPNTFQKHNTIKRLKKPI